MGCDMANFEPPQAGPKVNSLFCSIINQTHIQSKRPKNILKQNSQSQNVVIAKLSVPRSNPFFITATPWQRYPNISSKNHAQLAVFA